MTLAKCNSSITNNWLSALPWRCVHRRITPFAGFQAGQKLDNNYECKLASQGAHDISEARQYDSITHTLCLNFFWFWLGKGFKKFNSCG